MSNKTNIKHLVIPGGVVYGFSFYGALRHLAIHGLWDMKNIETIHTCSVGGLFGVFLALGYDWETYDKYLIDRPWHEVFKFSLSSLTNCFQNTGIFGISNIEDVLLPLLNGKNIPKTVSLKEFYELNGINIHFYTTDLSTLELVDVSHKTHPEWTLIEAVYSTLCVPVLFKPFHKEGIIYTDGALYANYPIHELLKGYPDIEHDSILGINISRASRKNSKYYFSGNTFTLYDYLLEILFKVIDKLTIQEPVEIQNEVFIDSSFVPAMDMYSIVNSADDRRHLIEYGVLAAKQLLDSIHTRLL
jgi:predicted acylesterase/phospholipase RssA